MAEQTKQIPVAALKFAADLEMGDNGDGAKTIPIKVKARGAQAVDQVLGAARRQPDQVGMRRGVEQRPPPRILGVRGSGRDHLRGKRAGGGALARAPWPAKQVGVRRLAR